MNISEIQMDTMDSMDTVDDEEQKKVLDFEHNIQIIVQAALDSNKIRLTKSQFRDQLAGRFGLEWAEANFYRIKGVMDCYMKQHNDKINHFTLCLQGITQFAIEKSGCVCRENCESELVPIFGQVWFEKYEYLIPGIINKYIEMVNDSGVQRARINTVYDMPLAIPSSQGLHPNCATHAVAFGIAANLHRLYGQAHAVGRDQLLHVMQAMCGSWQGASLRALVLSVRSNICKDANVWFSNIWNDRRLRFKVSATNIDFDGMVAQLQNGMAIPTVVATKTENHAVCAVQVLQNDDDGSNFKAEALNSHGELEPIVIVTQHAPTHENEYRFMTACLLKVRIVEVRAGNGSFLPVPSVRSFPETTL